MYHESYKYCKEVNVKDIIRKKISINGPVDLEIYDQENLFMLIQRNEPKKDRDAIHQTMTDIPRAIKTIPKDHRLDFFLSYKPIPSRIETPIEKLTVLMKLWGMFLAHTKYWVMHYKYWTKNKSLGVGQKYQ